MKITKLLAFMLFLLINDKSYAANEDSLVLAQITLPKTTINESKDLLLTLVIKSNTDKEIIIPKYISLGYMQDSSGFVCFQLQKMHGKNYEDVKPQGTFDNLMPLELTDTLHKSELREIKQNINSICIPCRGKYRIRVVCLFSAFNKMKDVYSNWLYFNCEKAVFPSTGGGASTFL